MKDPPRQSGFSLHVFLSVVSCFTGMILKEFYRQRRRNAEMIEKTAIIGMGALGLLYPGIRVKEDKETGHLLCTIE